MHNQTDQMDAPETDGSAGVRKLASRVGSGGTARPGESPGASTLRGFGTTFANGGMRNWYVGVDGVKRWADNDQPAA